MDTNRITHALTWAGKRKVERARIRGPAVVYVFKCGRYVKIGVTANAKIRLSGIQVGNPVTVKCVCTLTSLSPYDAELALHNLLARYCQRGEWFVLPSSLIRALRHCITAPDALCVVRDFIRSEHPK